MALAKFAEDENQGLLPLTLDSRRAFASQLAMEPEGSAILERYPFLEEGLAALLDDGHMDAAFRLLGRMLSPAKSILWVVLSHDFADRNKASVSGESEKVRRALLAFAIEPQAGTKATAEIAGSALNGNHPLAIASGALALLGNCDDRTLVQPVSPETALFSDLIGRSVWLMALGAGGEERQQAIVAKRLAAKGVSLALYQNN